MMHSPVKPRRAVITDMTVISVAHITDGSCHALLHCMDPTGQIFHLTLGVFWFFGRPEPDFKQAAVNGDSVHGMAVAIRHADLLRAALATAFRYDAKRVTPAIGHGAQ